MHFYQQTADGVQPRHYVEMSTKPGQLRPTRMSDVKKAAANGDVWVPSVTTVLNVLDKPGLNTWRVDMHLEVAATLAEKLPRAPECLQFSRDKFLEECKRLTELELDKAPSAGTDIHKELEQFYSGTDPLHLEHGSLCVTVDNEIFERTGHLHHWQPERNFVSNGYGGQVDLSGNGWVIDFKSKQAADKFKPGKMAYNEHRMQLAAYREGLGMPTARAANVFVCLEDGQVDFHEHSEDELQKGWHMFQHALAIWQLQHDIHGRE